MKNFRSFRRNYCFLFQYGGFKQKFKLKDPTKPAMYFEITYQTCDDRVCLAPNTLEFNQKVTPKGATEEADKKKQNQQKIL
jgi:thiol:disulfide interchange protein DsbD